MTSTERTKAWRLANPERWKELQKRWRDKQPKKPKKPKVDPKEWIRKLRSRVFSHKESLGCTKCGYNTCGAALDWHHTDNNKERRITIKSYFSKLGEEERAKCILLCANCHRETHHQDLYRSDVH